MGTGQSLLRFLTCGSVDDGKSTLIGCLLHDAGLVPDDVLEQVRRDSRGRTEEEDGIDFSLLVDGLEAEREQGITIDVAHRYFATPRRSFIVADAPGHEQYTRNMATAASTASLAVLLVDARKGLLTQTRRHAIVASLMGVRHIVLAVNKMDLVEDGEAVFAAIRQGFAGFSAALKFRSVTAVPLSARRGDNVVHRSAAMPWHRGPTLLEHLETVDVDEGAAGEGPLRFLVEWVNRPDSDFRGLSGTVLSGSLETGGAVTVWPSGRAARIARIVTFGGDMARARTGDAVTVTLEEAVDAGRGDLLAGPEDAPEVADQFAAHLLWMGEEPLIPGRSYLLRQDELREGSRAEPAALALADLDLRRQGEVTATLVVEGDPALQAGRRVRVTGVRPALEGTYAITEAVHEISVAGYETTLSSRPPEPAPARPADQVTLGVVDDVDDPDDRARVRVRLPAYPDLVSGWAPVLLPAAGAGKGVVALPEVDDTVLVLLPGRDPAHAIVLGGLYGTESPPEPRTERPANSAQTAPPPAPGSPRRGETALLRTRDGQQVVLDGGHSLLSLTDGRSSVELGPDLVRITAATDLLIEAPGRALRVRARTVDFEEAP